VPPTVWIDTPADNSVVGGVVRVGVTATDDTGVRRVELMLDGVTIDVRTGSPFAF
jgi:hypothetical protein